MKRREFLWTGLLFVPAIRAGAQFGLRSPGFVGQLSKQTASSLTCQSFAESTTSNDYYDTSTNISQKIKFTGGGTVCQIDLKLQWMSGTDAKGKIQLWSNADRTGTQYGSDSNEVSVTSASYFPAAWATFTFGTQPTPPGDFWICLVKTGSDNFGWRIDYNHTNGSGYYPYTDASGDAAYCAYAFGANRTTTDCAFKLYTMQ